MRKPTPSATPRNDRAVDGAVTQRHDDHRRARPSETPKENGIVGVVGQGGLLRQGGQAGEQGGAGVDEQVVIDVGDPAGAGEFEGY
jgi:hypothetical protein